MSAVSGLCQRVLLMEKGRVTFDGPTHTGIARYALSSAVCPSVDLTAATNRQGQQEYGRFRSISLFDGAGRPCDHFAMGDPMIVELELECSRRVAPAEVGFGFGNSYGTTIHHFISTWEGLEMDLEPGRHRFRIIVPQVLVFPGTYALTPWFKRQGALVDDQVAGAIQLVVVAADVNGHSPHFERYGRYHVEVYCPSRWSYIPALERDVHLVTGGPRD
jgi:hypothetical protein